MKAAVFHELGKPLAVENVAKPQAGPGEIVLKVHYCGVCGSDLHFYQYGETEFPGVLPFILWHEPSGEVAAMV